VEAHRFDFSGSRRGVQLLRHANQAKRCRVDRLVLSDVAQRDVFSLLASGAERVLLTRDRTRARPTALMHVEENQGAGTSASALRWRAESQAA
jgi:hypothetical protein